MTSHERSAHHGQLSQARACVMSSIPGRLRVRLANVAWSGEIPLPHELEALLYGRVDYRWNPVAHSLVVTYDPRTLSANALFEEMETLFGEFKQQPRRTRNKAIGGLLDSMHLCDGASSTPGVPTSLATRDDTPEESGGPLCRPPWPKVYKIGALSSLTVSLAFAAAKARKVHVATGLAFVGFVALHIWTHRKLLLR